MGLLREHWMGKQFQTYHHSFSPLTCFCNSYFIQEVDLSIPFGDPRNSLYNTSRPSQGPKIYIDLTIEPYANMQKELVPHLGYESTALVKEWMTEFPQLG